MHRLIHLLFHLPQPGAVPELPLRLPLDGDPRVLDLVMHEYSALRSEIDTSLSAQTALLSFGSATIGLLVAAAGAVWKDEGILAGLVLLIVVPATAFLALAIHAGEMVRLFRAGLFLNHLENHVNCSLTGESVPTAGALIWEQWRIRDGSPDMAGHNRRAILLVFGLLGFGFMLVGYWRLHELKEVPEPLALVALTVSLGIGIQALRWIRRLHAFAYLHRKKYRQSCQGPAASS